MTESSHCLLQFLSSSQICRRPRASRQVEGSEADGGATAIARGSEEVVDEVRLKTTAPHMGGQEQRSDTG